MLRAVYATALIDVLPCFFVADIAALAADYAAVSFSPLRLLPRCRLMLPPFARFSP